MSYVFVLNACTLRGMNTYHRPQNLSKHYSVTVFLNSEPPINSNNFPECNDTKKINDPVDTDRKLNVHKTFRRRPGHLLNVLCTFSLRPVSAGYYIFETKTVISEKYKNHRVLTYSSSWWKRKCVWNS